MSRNASLTLSLLFDPCFATAGLQVALPHPVSPIIMLTTPCRPEQVLVEKLGVPDKERTQALREARTADAENAALGETLAVCKRKHFPGLGLAGFLWSECFDHAVGRLKDSRTGQHRKRL